MTDFRIRYNDEEDDLITIDNELDLQECFNANNLNTSNSNASDSNASDSNSSDSNASNSVDTTENQGEIDGFGLEKVINEGFANFQNIIQTIVTDVSNTLENDLNNLHATLQQPFQQAINTVNSNETEQIIKQEQIISQGPVIHNGVICDCCEKIIRGMRWKCLTCSNYDLCQDCKSKQPTIHNHANSHEFKPIPYPQNYCSSNSKRITASLHSAVCDFCESQIYGTRHKCINCPDFDLCNGCISLAPTQHPNHTFMPIYRPGEPDNYKAYIYLGASYTELNKLNECENALKRAIEIDSSQIVPWKGLKKLYEEQKNWTNLSNTYLELLGRYNESKDAQNTLDTINKLVELYTHKVKDNKNLIVTLKYFLPESPYYDLIKVLPGVVAKSRQSLQTIISLLEKDEPEIIQREIKSRKSRINSGPPELVQAQVEQELEEFYDKLFEIVKKSDNSDLDSENLKKNYIEHIRKKLSVSSVDNKNRVCL
ncbi:5385_t:CDS:10 [Entrophospora sp. SA101]|nr:5385_t:CDS:10 [Entrophospora sp. SA101]